MERLQLGDRTSKVIKTTLRRKSEYNEETSTLQKEETDENSEREQKPRVVKLLSYIFKRNTNSVNPGIEKKCRHRTTVKTFWRSLIDDFITKLRRRKTERTSMRLIHTIWTVQYVEHVRKTTKGKKTRRDI